MDKRLDTGGSCHLLDDSIERSSDVRVIAAKRPGLVASFNAPGHVLVEPRLIEALLRHPYTENTREPHRILEVAICSSPGSFLALTRAVEAEMAGQRASGTETQSRRPCPVARGVCAVCPRPRDELDDMPAWAPDPSATLSATLRGDRQAP
jgi:hypothetical protein